MRLIRKIYLAVLSSLLFVSIGMSSCTEVGTRWENNASVPKSIAGDYLSARFAQRNNDSVNAVKYYESALAKNPTSVELLKKGIELMMLTGDINQAVNYADRMMKAGEKSPDATLLLTLRKIKEHNFGDAESLLNQADIKKLEDVGTTSELVIPLLKVWVIAGKGDYEQALQILRDREKDGLESFINYQMALLYDLSGHAKEAEELFDNLSEGASKSLRLTEVTANFYKRIGNQQKADDLIAKFLEKNPGMDEAAFKSDRVPPMQNPVQGTSELMLEVASFLYSNRLDDMARGYTYMSLYLTPEFPHAKLLLAKLMTASEDNKNAIAILESIRSPAYFRWQARLHIARIYHSMEENDKAEQMLSAMAAEDSKDREALLTLGDVQIDQKKYAEAINTYTSALSRGTPEEDEWVIYYARGIAYERSKQWDQAEADFFKALELKPNQPDVLNYLGYSWLTMDKNISKAKIMLKTAVDLRPNDAHILDSYGWALFLIKDYKNAVKYLEQANLLMPHDVTTNDHLGDAYWRLGRTNEARFQWERALIFNPSDEEKVKLEAKIKQGLDVTPVAAVNIKATEELPQIESTN